MNPFVIHYVSGWPFFTGLFMILIGSVLTFCPGWFVKSYLSRLLCVIGWLNIFFAAAPLPGLLFVALFLIVFAQVIVGGTEKISLKIRLGFAAVLAVVVLIAFFVELPHWMAPGPLPLKAGGRVVIIGDSMSAGIGFAGEKTWGDLLHDEQGMTVINRSVGGGTASTGVNSLEKTKVNKNDIIVVEIGGNDFFKGTHPDKFYKDLEQLLSEAKRKSPNVIMFELPLPFLKKSFGRTQRELAEKYKVRLIPKYQFGNILVGTGSIHDGLHLSNKGHRKMAKVVLSYIDQK